MDALNKVQLPGENQTQSMGTGTSCGIIGQGGSAIVYKTYLQSLELYRAVKILLWHRICDNEREYRKLLQRGSSEAKLQAKIHNSNIVQVHHFGDWNGLPYIEMEYVNGLNLKKLVNNFGALPVELCTAIGIMASKGLRFAHKTKYQLDGETHNGLIHRDIKPENILCSEQGEIKIADFGLAKTYTPIPVSDQTVGFVGSSQYASPEQISTGKVDARSDIYSLGVTLYELLCGKEMFKNGPAIAVFAARTTNKYIPLEKAQRGINKNLLYAIAKCTEQDPEKRFFEAAELVEILENCHKKVSRLSPEDILEKYFVDKNLIKNVPRR